MKKNKVIVLFLMLITISTLWSQQQYTMQARDYESFYSVTVVGVVRNPGVHRLPPTSRVSDAMKFANTVQDTIVIHDPPKNASSRNITLKRGEQEFHIDMHKYFISGNDELNPYIKDGDTIIVPPIQNTVYIYGAIHKANEYIELIEADRVKDIIDLTMGLKPNAYKEEAMVVRYSDDHKSSFNIPFSLENAIADPSSEANLPLEHGDRIFIRSIPEYQPHDFVNISGEVRFPGLYPIDEDQTTLLQILEQAGGPTENANLADAFLQRKREEDIRDAELVRLQRLPRSALSQKEIRYINTRIQEDSGIYGVDIEQLWQEKEETIDVPLKRNDFIYVPDKTMTVNVTGQVVNPGLFTHIPGQNYEFYIGKAGGYSWKESKGGVRIIRAETGVWIKPKSTTVVEVGDTIFVPERKRFSYYWPYIKETMSFLSGLATIIVVVQNIIGN